MTICRLSFIIVMEATECEGLMRNRRRLPFESTLPPLLYLHIEMVCNGWTGEMSSEERLDIVQLLRSLPLKQRTSVVLKAQGYTFAEIARVTGCSAPAAHTCYRRAERNIRGKWNGDSDSGPGGNR